MTTLIQIAYRELLHDYYQAQRKVISEFSGDMDTDIRELRLYVNRRSLAFLQEVFDFTDEDGVDPDWWRFDNEGME